MTEELKKMDAYANTISGMKDAINSIKKGAIYGTLSGRNE